MLSYKDHVTNEEVWARIKKGSGLHESQTAVVRSYFLFIRSGQNHFVSHSRRGKTRWTKKAVGRQHPRMDNAGVWQVPEGSGEQGKLEKTGCKIISGIHGNSHGEGVDDDDIINMCVWDLNFNPNAIPETCLHVFLVEYRIPLFNFSRICTLSCKDLMAN